MKVKKKSNKPFKSGLKINTVKGETINKQTGRESYVFYEDDSDVEKTRCEIIKE